MKIAVRDPSEVTWLAPEFGVQLGEGETLEWAVAKPVDLTATHGVNITVERLMEMAASYNPQTIEAAPINFDHAPGGPAQGWIKSMQVREGLLWVQPVELSADMVEGVRTGRYRRASIEFNTAHPETGGWYLNGLAVLGNAKPAIKGLPQLRLAAPRYVIQLEEEAPSDGPEETTTLPVEPGQGEAMSDKTKAEASGATAVAEDETQRGILAALGELVKRFGGQAAEAATAAPAPVGTVTLAEVDKLVEQKVNAKLAEQRLSSDLGKLEGKAIPAALKAARPMLERALAEGREADYTAGLAMLSAQDASVLLGGELASAEQAGATVTGVAHSQEDVAFFESIGIKADRVAAIEQKHNLRPYVARMRRQAES